MIQENKTSKYMLYAIGEIILVVIGILIALTINNWNEERKNELKENVYLEGIKNDLELDVEYMDRITYFNSKGHQSFNNQIS